MLFRQIYSDSPVRISAPQKVKECSFYGTIRGEADRQRVRLLRYLCPVIQDLMTSPLKKMHTAGFLI